MPSIRVKLTAAYAGALVATTAAFLSSDLGAGITGSTVYVDKGYHAMGMPVEIG